MHLVYITEPAWFEKPIPRWVHPNSHIIVTQSDSVINQAVVNNIDVLPLGKFFPTEMMRKLIFESIIQESKLRRKLNELLYPDQHLSELIHGTSNFIYEYHRLIIAIKGLLKSSIPTEVSFIYGDRYFASVHETPKGGWLEYLILSNECRNFGIRMKVRAHEFMKRSEIIKSSRYDRYLSDADSSQKCLNGNDNIQEVPTFYKKYVLFLYLYEMCKDDLEPLTNPKNWSDNCGILVGKLSKHAPTFIAYHFDFSKAFVTSDRLKREQYRKLKESVGIIFENYFRSKSNMHANSTLIINHLKRNALSGYKNAISIIASLDAVITKYNIKYAVLTGYQGPPNSVIASWLAARGIAVTIRQHGTICYPYWPLQCAVEKCNISVNSNYYKKDVEDAGYVCYIMPRKRSYISSLDTNKDAGESKSILIAEDLFLNPTNKILNIRFFSNFINWMPPDWIIVLRGHPRYSGVLLPGFDNPRIIKEFARDKSIGSSLRNTCVLVCPLDTLSSCICDAIIAGVPAVVVAPEDSINIYNFEPVAWGYPLIVSRPRELIKIISRIKSEPEYVKEIMKLLDTWMDSILGDRADILEINGNKSYQLNTVRLNTNVNIWKYIKMFCRTKIKSIRNRWHISLNPS